MNESIKKLLSLQTRDTEVDRLRAEAAAVPALITKLKADIQANKTALEAAKKDLIQFQLAKKEKDIDLDIRDATIRKHTGELNVVKTNEAYKALVGEIDKAKREKSELEDQVLVLMEQIDTANKSWKEKEAAAKGVQDGFQKQISEWESKQQAIESQIQQKVAEREAEAGALDAKLIEPYNRLRQNKRVNAVVPVRKEQCMGCHMKVSQNLLNEIRRGQKMMPCESCARIVYLEEVPQEAKPA